MRGKEKQSWCPVSSIGPQLSPKDWCVLNLELIVEKRRDAVETKERTLGRW